MYPLFNPFYVSQILGGSSDLMRVFCGRKNNKSLLEFRNTAQNNNPPPKNLNALLFLSDIYTIVHNQISSTTTVNTVSKQMSIKLMPLTTTDS